MPAEFLGLMLSSDNMQSIADRLGVDRNTVSKWARDPDIVAELDAARRAVLADARRKGSQLMEKVVETLECALDATSGCPVCREPTPDHAIRIRAAAEVADRFGVPKTTVTELADRAGDDDRSDTDLATDILAEAVAIAESRGRPDVARSIRSLDLATSDEQPATEQQ